MEPFRQTGRTTKMIRAMPDLCPPTPKTIPAILDLDASERMPISQMLVVMCGTHQYEMYLRQRIDEIKGCGYSKNVDIYNIYKTSQQHGIKGRFYNRFDIYVDPVIYDCCTKEQIVETWDIINPCLK